MRYPTIALDDSEQIAETLLADGDSDIPNKVQWVGEPPDIDVDRIDALVERLHDALDNHIASGNDDSDAFEGVASGDLHATLSEFDVGVLDDPGFWRYLSLAKFWRIVCWREAGAFKRGWPQYRRYVDGHTPPECVVLRMFLRGRISDVDGDHSLACAVPKATDFWRSHIIRVRTSYAPVLARQLVREQRDRRMSTNVVRDYAKRIQRVASNVVLQAYDEEDAAALLHQLREDEE